ncbi:MAG: substrate-binding domain-containing protein, partial [Erysipelotrichaceae bacterium]
MKKLLVLLLSTALLFSLTACGSSSDSSADAGDDSGSTTTDTIVIGANIYSGSDSFMNGVVKPALEAAAAEAGAQITIADSQGDQATLSDQVDTFITQGVDVLAINLVDPASAGEIIAKAQAADIPLILFNKEATDDSMTTYDKVWYVGTDSAESGIIQGEMMVADILANPEWDKNA